MSTSRLHRVGAVIILSAALAPGLLAGQAPGGDAIHGFVREAGTGEPIGLAAVELEGGPRSTTDRDGYFRVRSLAPGERRVRVRAFGYEPLDTVVTVSPQPHQLRLRTAALALEGVSVVVERAGDRPLPLPEVSVRTVTVPQIRRVPAALETDVFRAIQALPGVVAPSAFSSRLLVRGGAADQNLFLLDGYPVIHPYHLTGAFSAFHTEAVRDVELWTAAPPARYGGRLSSVVDVGLREGNAERYSGAASLGLVSSSAVLEGPHRRGAWFTGVRATYLDLVTGAVGTEVPYRFYDAYAKGYADVTALDRLSVLLFLGQDRTWRAGSGADRFDWRNEVYGLSWRRLIGGRGVLEHRVSLSRFAENLDAGFSSLHNTSILTDHTIVLGALRGDLRLDLAARHQLEAGWSIERRRADHLVQYTDGFPRIVRSERVGTGDATLLGVYVQDDIAITDALALRLGARGEAGPGERSVQPRLAVKLMLSPTVAVSGGLGLLRQYDQLMQDPDANFDIYTADLWVAAGEAGIPVARSAHAVVGAEARFPHGLRARGEVYHKRSQGLVTVGPYDPESGLLAIERLETATGIDRGVDLSIAREGGGPVRGWVGYSLASAQRTTEAEAFPADPHPRQRLIAVLEMDPWRRWGTSLRFEGFEGVPFTPAVAMLGSRPYDFGTGGFTDQCAAVQVEYFYGDRNAARTGWSKRLDVGAGRRWSDRRGRQWEISLSVLNALFDPTGVFRPKAPEGNEGCLSPSPVRRDYELVLPAIPSIGVRVEF